MRLFAIALVALGLAACAGGDDVPEESPARFAVRIATLLRQGEFATAWIDLHPEHKKLVTRTDLESCWTQTDDVLNNPDERRRRGLGDPRHDDDAPEQGDHGGSGHPSAVGREPGARDMDAARLRRR